jgi:hypothetical protein
MNWDNALNFYDFTFKLYMTKFSQDAKQILESGNEMAVALHITSG